MACQKLSSAENDLEITTLSEADDTDQTMEISASRLLDIEVIKLNDLIAGLEELERVLETTYPNKQTTSDNTQTIVATQGQVNVICSNLLSVDCGCLWLSIGLFASC